MPVEGESLTVMLQVSTLADDSSAVMVTPMRGSNGTIFMSTFFTPFTLARRAQDSVLSIQASRISSVRMPFLFDPSPTSR